MKCTEHWTLVRNTKESRSQHLAAETGGDGHGGCASAVVPPPVIHSGTFLFHHNTCKLSCQRWARSSRLEGRTMQVSHPGIDMRCIRPPRMSTDGKRAVGIRSPRAQHERFSICESLHPKWSVTPSRCISTAWLRKGVRGVSACAVRRLRGSRCQQPSRIVQQTPGNPLRCIAMSNLSA